MSSVSGTTEVGAPLGASSEDVTFYLDDHLGTAQYELSSSGWPRWGGQFDAYGKELTSQTATFHYKFTGKERDTESGLDYFGARHNHPINSVDADGHASNDQKLAFGCLGEMSDLGNADGGSNCQAMRSAQGSAVDSNMEFNEQQYQNMLAQNTAQSQNFATGFSSSPVTPFSPIVLPGTDTTVTGQIDGITAAGSQGVAITADPSNCSGCRWVQVVTAENGMFTDVPNPSSIPLYPLNSGPSNELRDAPLRPGAVQWSAVSVVGDTNAGSSTFKARGAIKWGFSISKKGVLSISKPVRASRAQQAAAINQAKKDYPGWTF